MDALECRRRYAALKKEEQWVINKREEYDSLCDCAIDRQLVKWCNQRYKALDKHERELSIRRRELDRLCEANDWDFADPFFDVGGTLEYCTEL